MESGFGLVETDFFVESWMSSKKRYNLVNSETCMLLFEGLDLKGLKE
jgi:hypothetical protein